MDDRTKGQLLVGREHFARGEYDGAETALRDVLASDDRFADVHDMLGIIAHARGNFVAAEHHFERALQLNPNYTEAALNLAVTYNDRGKYEAARELYAQLRSRPEATQEKIEPFARGKIANMHAELAQAYLDAAMPHDAINQYERAVELCPDFADLRTKLGSLLRDTGNLSRARMHFEEAVKSRPNYVPGRVHLGATLLALGETTLAEEQWKRVLELEPENTRAKMYLRMSGVTKPAT